MEKEAKPPSLPTPATKDLLHIPGAEPSARIDAWWGLVAGVIGLTIALAILRPDPYLRIIKFVRDGILISILVTIVSFLLVLVAGLFGGLGRLSKNTIIHGISTLYVEMVRGVPLLVQLLFWYYAFPDVIKSLGSALGIEALANYRANAILMAILGMTVCYGAYMSEIYRAGIQSIPKGQLEAARSLGMSYAQAMRYIVLPQAVRVILPPVGNEFISLLKDSSLVSVVAVADLTRRGREFMSANFIPLPTWTMVGLLYLIMTLFSARIVAGLEKRTTYER
jgi:polar amino acid transport system permease protein